MESRTFSSSENDHPSKRRKIQHEFRRKSKLTQCLTKYTQFLITPDAPIIFSSYVRVLFHSFGVVIILIILFQFMRSFSTEIQARYAMDIQGSREKALVCHSHYVEHNCGPDLRGSTWKSICEEWDRCRNSPPPLIGKTKLIAQVFGELMNGFVEPLSIKAMLIIFLLVFGFFIVSNFVII